MFLGYLVLLTSLTISAVAIYYSVAGLVAIFAAATIPIIIMGTTLEVAKLVTAVWLHKYWGRSVWWLKTYLSVSVIVLMFITSMGIFGFLSKAHIDQTSSATESVARIEQLDTQINKKLALVADAKSEINDLETSGSNRDNEIQAQIDAEQQRIDSAYERIQPAIDEQNSIIEKEEQRLGGGLSLYETQLSNIEDNLKNIEEYISSNNIKLLQSLVGVEADGNLGPATTRAIEAFRVSQTAEKQRLSELIAQESVKLSSPVIDTARAEIQRLRGLAEQEIASSNELNSRLRQQLGTTNTEQVDVEVAKQNLIIENAEKEISSLTEQKFGLESEYRKLEAEVGPVKYLAEFVYGDTADKDMLEEAVRWVIVIIIFVFDPLAVLLLIASQYTFSIQQQQKPKPPEPPVPPVVTKRKTKQNAITTVTPTEKKQSRVGEDKAVPKKVDRRRKAKVAEPVVVEPPIVPSVVDEDIRAALLAETELLDEWKAAKKKWKDENPDLNLKAFKDDYVQGRIAELPWAVYVEDGTYIQNSEQQDDNTLWKRIRERDNGSNNGNNPTGQTV